MREENNLQIIGPLDGRLLVDTVHKLTLASCNGTAKQLNACIYHDLVHYEVVGGGRRLFDSLTEAIKYYNLIGTS